MDKRYRLLSDVVLGERSGAFTGKVNNGADIGMTKEDYTLMWNDDLPADP